MHYRILESFFTSSYILTCKLKIITYITVIVNLLYSKNKMHALQINQTTNPKNPVCKVARKTHNSINLGNLFSEAQKLEDLYKDIY